MSETASEAPRLPADQDVRNRILTSLDESLLVEAAAGTGKTTQLVGRLVAVLASGRGTIERVAAVTFTKKAAGELKLRLRQELDRARDAPKLDADQKARLEVALARLEEAQIGTIHSFCSEVLRQRPLEAGIDPSFEEMDDDVSARLYDRAFRTWIEQRLDDLPEGLRRALARLTRQGQASPIERLRGAGRSLLEWRDFAAPWKRVPLDRTTEIDRLVEAVESVGEMVRNCPNPRDRLRRAMEPALDLAQWIARSEHVAARDYDELEGQLVALETQLRRDAKIKGRGKTFADGISRETAVASRDSLLQALTTFRDHVDADLAALLRSELGEVLAAYEELKYSTGRIDYLDLLIRTRDLLRTNPTVRRDLQGRFDHLFIDEFQDTDPLQVEILLLMASADPRISDWRQVVPAKGKLFLVGDPKQSIYRFRRADVLLYQQVKQHLEGVGVSVVHLTTSFRAQQPLQELVNAAFSDVMVADDEIGQPDYIPLASYRSAIQTQPQIVALPVPQPAVNGRVTNRRIEEGLPACTAAFIGWLLQESGWQVPHRGDLRPLVASDIAIVFRRFMSWGRDVTEDYARELEARSIPHLLIGGRSIHRREEIATLRAALNAIEWPDDELSIFATLRGSLFAISDSLLLQFRSHIGKLHPFLPLPDNLDSKFLPIISALETISELHRRRNFRPIVESLNDILHRTRSHAGFALRPSGRQVLANVQRLCDLARSFELGGGLSFRGFVERLNDEAEQPGSGRAPMLEEGADGVRMITAHRAKGLEFPVVVLADMTAKLAAQPDRVVDVERDTCALKLLGCAPWELREHFDLEMQRNQAEGIRLAYVAATRARDLLVVPTLGVEPFETGWLSPLNTALYPKATTRTTSKPAVGCPAFGPRSAIGEQFDSHGQPQPTVRPGELSPQRGDHRVVWWDPELLGLEIDASFGLRQEQILAPTTAADDGVDHGLQRYDAWCENRQAKTQKASTETYQIITVTEAEEGPPDFHAEIRVEALARSAQRPKGPRFGTLVHTILRDVALPARTASSKDNIVQLAHLHRRLLGATTEEVDAAVEAVSTVLRHESFLNTENLFRELPFSVEVDTRTRVEGTIDLVYQQDDRWVVVDFKTDAAEAIGDRYRQQLSWYVFAMEKMTGMQAEGVLLAI